MRSAFCPVLSGRVRSGTRCRWRDPSLVALMPFNEPDQEDLRSDKDDS